MKRIIFVGSVFISCIALQINQTYAQGIPLVLAPQIDALRASRGTDGSSKLLGQVLATQQATLAQLAAIHQDLQPSATDQHMILHVLTEQLHSSAVAQGNAQHGDRSSLSIPGHIVGETHDDAR